MKTRSFISIAITITSVLLLILTMTAAAQGSTDKAYSGFASDLSRVRQNTTGSAYTAETFTLANPRYLPLVYRDYGVCSRTPTLVFPGNGGQLVTLSPLFTWDDGSHPEADAVYLDVATDSAFNNMWNSLASYASPGIQQFRFSTNLNPATIYYYRAWFQCGNLQGPFSATWSFRSGSGGVVLPAPALIAPANGSLTPSTTVTLQWSAVPDAIEYLLKWGEIGGFSYYFTWVSGTQDTISMDPSKVYEWTVAARNDYAVGTVSETWQFTTPPGLSDLSPQTLNPIFRIENGTPSITFELPAQEK